MYRFLSSFFLVFPLLFPFPCSHRIPKHNFLPPTSTAAMPPTYTCSATRKWTPFWQSTISKGSSSFTAITQTPANRRRWTVLFKRSGSPPAPLGYSQSLTTQACTFNLLYITEARWEKPLSYNTLTLALVHPSFPSSALLFVRLHSLKRSRVSSPLRLPSSFFGNVRRCC